MTHDLARFAAAFALLLGWALLEPAHLLFASSF